MKQIIDMVARHRTISSGYFDTHHSRFVRPMSLAEAAKNLDMRHRALTGEDQRINISTLTDYHRHVIKGYQNGFNFGPPSIYDLRKFVDPKKQGKKHQETQTDK